MSEEFSEITLSRAGDVATVEMSRPDALNAITPGMLGELNTAFDLLAEDPDTRFVILTGAGRAFSAGVDLKALGARKLEQGKVGDILDLPARALTGRMTALAKPVIARVNGFCFTGALELALACDLIVVSDKARLGDTHAKWALRPTWGMSQRLPARIGLAKARELSFTGRTLTGQDAFDLGLANAVAPHDQLDSVIDALLDEIRPNSTAALAAYKDLYRAAENLGLADGLAFEAATDYAFDTAETESRLAAFRE